MFPFKCVFVYRFARFTLVAFTSHASLLPFVPPFNLTSFSAPLSLLFFLLQCLVDFAFASCILLLHNSLPSHGLAMFPQDFALIRVNDPTLLVAAVCTSPPFETRYHHDKEICLCVGLAAWLTLVAWLVRLAWETLLASVGH